MCGDLNEQIDTESQQPDIHFRLNFVRHETRMPTPSPRICLLSGDGTAPLTGSEWLSGWEHRTPHSGLL